ncbi:MAG: hypothetical protein JXR95_15555, partial [Deltaproteobacteria bacterium]|nr:hypothetical protein [Deltaproteobacteria bacterium]
VRNFSCTNCNFNCNRKNCFIYNDEKIIEIEKETGNIHTRKHSGLKYITNESLCTIKNNYIICQNGDKQKLDIKDKSLIRKKLQYDNAICLVVTKGNYDIIKCKTIRNEYSNIFWENIKKWREIKFREKIKFIFKDIITYDEFIVILGGNGMVYITSTINNYFKNRKVPKNFKILNILNVKLRPESRITHDF